MFETNAFYIPSAKILIDAPEGAAEWLAQKGYRVDTLLLTHGHVDHVWDAAQIQREQHAAVYYHPGTAPMVMDPKFYERLGFPWTVAPIAEGHTLEAAPECTLGGIVFQVLEVPGHCPGSLCFYHADSGLLFGGDVLFAGGVGRWDLPGGDRDLLLGGIRGKLFPLGDDVKVLSGHGPVTTIGLERKGNPYLS
jgi:hydroxyacylglutathione hydrolase